MNRMVQSQHFAAKHAEVIRLFFSRDARLWPLLGATDMQRVRQHCESLEKTKTWFTAEDRESEIGQDVLKSSAIPKDFSEAGAARVLDRAVWLASRSSMWHSARSVENVGTIPSDPALVGAALCTLANPNLVNTEYR